jgi:hypothetical protein
MPYYQESYDGNSDAASVADTDATEELSRYPLDPYANTHQHSLQQTSHHRFPQTPPYYGGSRAPSQWPTGPPPGTGVQPSAEQAFVHSSMYVPQSTCAPQLTVPGTRYGPTTSGYYSNSIPAWSPPASDQPSDLVNRLANLAINHQPGSNAPRVETSLLFDGPEAYVDTRIVARSTGSRYSGKEPLSVVAARGFPKAHLSRTYIVVPLRAHIPYASRCRFKPRRSFHTAVRDESRGAGRPAAASGNGLQEQ